MTGPEAHYASHLHHLHHGYERALGSEWDGVVIGGGHAKAKSQFDDQDHPLVLTAAFRQWVPLLEAGAWLVITPGQRPKLIRTAQPDFWEAPTAPPFDFWQAFEVVSVPVEKLDTVLPTPSAAARFALIAEDEPLPASASLRAMTKNPAMLVDRLAALRTRKTPYELTCLRQASERAVRGHLATERAFLHAPADATPSELALHLAYLAASEQDDAETPYKNIVALGAHAATLHYVSYQRARGTGAPSLLVDAGATHAGYASDITRTYAHPSAPVAFRELLAAMEELQQAMVAHIRPGMAYQALHDRCHERLAEVLSELDLAGGARGSTEALVDSGVTRALFPHGLGHSLGLQVHDVGTRLTPPRPENRFLRNTSTIDVGQVFTIEPGIYFIDALLGPLRTSPHGALVNWTALDALAPCGGIRIEDNVAVHEQRIENLTRDAFRILA